MDEKTIRVAGEFASVDVNLDEDANGPRLKITDLRSGLACHLDPLELEALARAGRERLATLVQPLLAQAATDG